MAHNVGEWLQQLGLGKYAEAFAENDVEFEVLSELRDDDLSQLGLSLGHRRKFLKAAAELTAGAQPEAPTDVAEASPASPKRAEAERRQLTVMFCDLVGSTELSARLDPEDMREVIRAYQNTVAREIVRFDGHVAKFMGDGVLSYFGWPRAHEDDAERAVRASLAAADAVSRLTKPTGDFLAARIGIATGLVVVGDLTGEGAAQEEAVIGETPNLAARLQGIAEPNAVVISPSTRQLLGDVFEIADLGQHALKGIGQPVRPLRVIGERATESRFEASHVAGLTPFSGREQEVALLLDRWQLAKGGEGQMVLLSGEPGIGKSRIAHMLRERIAGEPHTRLRYQCLPYYTNSALHPIIAQLEFAAGFAPNDTPERKLEKLEAMLARQAESVEEIAPLFAPLLSLPTDDRYPPLNFTPQRQKEKTLEAWVDQLAGLAARKPVLIIFEDAHWIDPTTQELMDLTVDRIQDLRVLAIVTFRPEFAPPWTGHSHATALALNRLGRQHCVAMVGELTGGKTLPDVIFDQIVAKTDGVPLFVEELTKTVLEAGFLKEAGDRYELDGPLPPLAIPSTLRDSLTARLDRLAPVKEIAQIGAVIGREFSHDLLAMVVPLSEGRLSDALDMLIEAELIFRRGTPPEATYTFKHALVQDAAYGGLLRSRRQEFHARISKVLVERYPETCNHTPEIVARHFSEAGLFEDAITFWQAAGRKASERSAFKEVVGHLSTALKLLVRLPRDPRHLEQELVLQTSLGPALIATRGFAAAEVGHTYARAHELCKEIGQRPELFPVLWGSWVIHTVRAELNEANELGEQLLELARVTEEEDLILQSHHALETSLFWCGRFAEALEHMRLGLAIYELERHGSHAAVYGGHDPAVCCLAFQSMAMWICGYFDQAERSGENAILLARQLQQPASLAHAQQISCRLGVFRRDAEAVAPKAEALVEFTTMHGFRHPLALAQVTQGWAMAKQGQVEAGIARVQQGMDAHDRAGAKLDRSSIYAMLAELFNDFGQICQAKQHLEAAFVHILECDERYLEAELWRLRGQLVRAQNGSAAKEVEACFRRAIAIAQEQGARAWELRAATSLARLLTEQGERHKAHDLLAPIYGWFTEGFDTPDLNDAKVLLDDLA